MNLRYRPVCPKDLEECSYCIRDRFAYDETSRVALIALWHDLLVNRAANAMVMEDMSGLPGRRIVWFCFKVYIPNDYAQYLKTDAEPFVGRQIVERYRAGASPLMNFAQMRKANTPGQSGLNLLVMNSGSPPHVFEAGMWPLIAGKVVEFTPLCAGGYRLNELFIEVYDDFTATWVEGTGMHLRNAYDGYYAVPGRPQPIDSQRPRLYGITQAEANRALGTSFSAIFYRQQPQYGFTPAEQELLQWCLFGESDQDAAVGLNVSLASIRKRWAGIYTKVAIATPELLDSFDTVTEQRGSEKKRRLLSYLRHHLEELRPVLLKK